MKKKRMVLVMAVSAMCMMAGCGNTVKDGTEALEQGDKKQETLLQEMKYNEIICLEKTADWEMAKEKMSEYQAAYPEDDSVAKEAEFLQTR